jgi:hypothetical protein
MDSLFIEPPQLGPFGKTGPRVVRIQHQGTRYLLTGVIATKRPSELYDKVSRTKGGRFFIASFIGRAMATTSGAQCRLNGWRADAEQPDYGEVVSVMSEYMLKHGFEQDNEVELRIGRFSSRNFVAGVPPASFHKIMERLSEDESWTRAVIYSKHKDYAPRGQRLRIFEDGRRSLVNKRKSAIVDVRCEGCPFDFRVSFAKEKPLNTDPEMEASIIRDSEHSRWTDRVTYEYKHYSFELSVVTNVKGAGEDREEARDSFDETPGDDGSAIYEVEIELKPDRDGFPKKSRSHARILAESLVLKMLDLVYFVEDVDCRSIAFRSLSGRDRQKAKPPGAT